MSDLRRADSRRDQGPMASPGGLIGQTATEGGHLDADRADARPSRRAEVTRRSGRFLNSTQIPTNVAGSGYVFMDGGLDLLYLASGDLGDRLLAAHGRSANRNSKSIRRPPSLAIPYKQVVSRSNVSKAVQHQSAATAPAETSPSTTLYEPFTCANGPRRPLCLQMAWRRSQVRRDPQRHLFQAGSEIDANGKRS